MDKAQALTTLADARFSSHPQWRSEDSLALLFASAAKRFGKAPVQLTNEERTQLVNAGVDWELGGWTLDELARGAILLRSLEKQPAAQHASTLDELFRQGDTRERTSLLKTLPFLPHPEACLSLAIESCRSSVQPIFEAIACENPYPAAYFPELNFNQLVLKALFVEVSLKRVTGLRARATPELFRMARDYANERKAAGRSIPTDIEWLIQTD